MYRKLIPSAIAAAVLLLLSVELWAATPPPFEVRTFITSVADTDPSYQFHESCIRGRYVCPYCGYSSNSPGICPNPWQVAGHPANVALIDTKDMPQQRVLSLSNIDMPPGKADVVLPDAAGNLHPRAVIGRPFQPADYNTVTNTADTRRSVLHMAAAGLYNSLSLSSTGGTPFADRFRWFIMPPTPDTGSSLALPGPRPMAQPDPDTTADVTTGRGLQVVDASSGARTIDMTTLKSLMTVGVNPYRVDDGDYWWIRYTETVGNTAGQVSSVHVILYSVLYGLQADLTYDVGSNGGFPFSLLADSGAIMVTFSQPFHNDPNATNDTATWVMRFMVRSNCRLIPGWQDMADPSKDPTFTDLSGTTHTNTSSFDLLTGTFPAAKECWYTAGTGVPSITDASTVVGTGKAAQPYIIPSNHTGRGMVAAEYAGAGSTGSTDWVPTATSAQPAKTIFYRPGGEWQYDRGILYTNKDVAGKTAAGWTVNGAGDPTYDGIYHHNGSVNGKAAYQMGTNGPWLYWDTTSGKWLISTNNTDSATAALYTGTGPDLPANAWAVSTGTTPAPSVYVQVNFLASYFMSSRVDVPPTLDTWDHGTASDVVEVNDGTGYAYPRVVIGLVSALHGIVTGDFAPGCVTTNRTFQADNRWRADKDTVADPVSGAVWGPDAVGAPTAGQPSPYPAIGDRPVITLTGAGSGGAYSGRVDTWRNLVSFGRDEQTGATGVEHVLPTSTLEPSDTWCSPGYDYTSGGTVNSLNGDSPVSVPQAIAANIPRYQPPSVPPGATNVTNDETDDRGYRGGAILFRNTGQPSGSTAALTTGWDVYFKCPDDGFFVTQVDDTTGLPVHTCKTPHFFCPVCGAEYTTSGTCPFDGNALIQMPATRTCNEQDLEAEEYDPFDLQVSVNRQVSVSPSLVATEIGRTEPGVPLDQPDTTVGPLVNHRAFPADVSPLAPFISRNEGNVDTTMRLGNTYQYGAGSTPHYALDNYLRVPVDFPDRNALSYARRAESGPITRNTFFPYDDNLNQTDQWLLLPQSVGQPAGLERMGFMTAGTYTGTVKPVPLGQPAGYYSGAQLMYVDANGNGAFDFYSVALGKDTTTATTPFDPTVDWPEEPLCAVVNGEMHVVESRLPQNGYYSLDADPAVLPSLTAGALQVVWVTNRVSTDPTVNSSAASGQPAPAGTNPTATPNSNSPMNLVYVTATGSTGGANDPLYRLYSWPVDSGGNLTPPTTITADPPGTVNASPWAMFNTAGSYRWLFWHQNLQHPGGVQSTLHFDSSNDANWTWPAPNPNSLIYSGLSMQNVRGFPTASGAWLFWNTGPKGHQRLMYRWNFTGTVDNNEGPVAVTNQANPAQTSDVITTPEGYTIRRPSTSPFVYTKDPSVFAYTPPGGTPQVNVFFSGYVRSAQEADICWTRYDMAKMKPANASDPGQNYGKLAFAPITDEEMKSDGLHQLFRSRNLDWLVRPTFAQSGPVGAPDPTLRLGLVFDAIGDDQPPAVEYFNVTWTNGMYLRSRGTYRVTPSFTPLGSYSLPTTCASATGNHLVLPGTTQPITMDIDPAAGTVQFSSPLYNEDVPGDPTTVTHGATAGGLPIAGAIMDVSYTPYVYRVTRDSAQDDSPSAFYDPTGTHRLICFWRRSYSASQAPDFGRAAFMYKVYTTSVQVGRPPVTSWTSVSGNTVPYTTDSTSGILTAGAADVGRILAITYDGAGGTYTERLQVMGWSKNYVVPIDTVMGEGPLVVVPESYTVPATEGSTTGVVPAVRYWLFWSSPRGVWDLRLVEDSRKTRQAGDLPVHPSSDVYTAVVSPDFSALTRQTTISSVTSGPT